MGSGNSKQIFDQIQQATCVGFNPPLSFTLWLHRSFGVDSYSIGPEKSKSIYHISASSNLSGGDIVLHNGPSEAAPALAVVGGGGHRATITLPPVEPGLPGFQSEFSTSRWSHDAYGFQVPIGPGKQVAGFEWRRSSGGEVQSLGEGWRGWKLVSSDSQSGGEVLAAWSNSSFSWSRAAEFQFLNSGATGQLGNAFALMAIMSFVKLHQRMMQNQRRRAAAAAAA